MNEKVNQKKGKSRKKGKGFYSSKAKQLAKEGSRTIELDNGVKRSVYGIKDVKYPNDPSWYKFSEQLAKDAASVSFNNRLGAPLRDYDANAPLSSANLGRIGGLYSIRFGSVPGTSRDAQSPINLASNGIFSKMREKISGNRPYQRSDVLIYMLAMSSVFQFYAFMIRLYGLIRKYNILNTYFPETYFTACGCSFSDFMANGHTLRFYINTFAKKVGNLVVPKGFTFFDREMFMCKEVYYDKPNPKAQTYMFVPEYYWLFGLDSEGAGKLTPSVFATADEAKTVADLMQFGDNLISNIAADDDFNIISGDLLKTFGDLWQMTPIDENYTCEVVYSKEVLEQIHNLCVIDTRVTNAAWSGFEVTQKADDNLNDFILFDPSYIVTGTVANRARTMCSYRMIDLDSDNPTTDEILTATRLMWSLYETEVSGTFKFSVLPTELVFNCSMYWFNNSGILQRLSDTNAYALNKFNPTDGCVMHIDNYKRHVIRQAWDYAPIAVSFTQDESLAQNGRLSWIGEFNNYTYVDVNVIDKLNTNCLLAEFNVKLTGAQY